MITIGGLKWFKLLICFCLLCIAFHISAQEATKENIAPNCCDVTASYTASWNYLYAIYDQVIGFGELSNDKTWGSWSESREDSHWLQYNWNVAYEMDSVNVYFWTDSQVAGTGVNVPESWKIEYFDLDNNTWQAVTLLDNSVYTCYRDAVNSVKFATITTNALRLTMKALGNSTTYSALGVTEWEVYATITNTNESYKDYPISGVDFSMVQLNDSFWKWRLVQNQDITIPIALQQCWNTGRVDNFLKAAGLMSGYFNTEYTFDDTDIYKILEGISYSIQTMPDSELKAQADTLIKIIAAAQEEDGYLYTARTAGEPGNLHPWVGENRWEADPDMSHELYNCGHLFEAAYAHYVSTGTTDLLNVAIKNADLLVKDFLEGGLCYEPGHQIVEMGLVKMYRATGKKEYLELAKYFLDLRGLRGVMRQEYSQTHKPVVMQDEAVGHAVRAGYMYCGMADVATMMNNANYLKAIDSIWSNVVSKKLYITGGIGALHDGESFGENYYLPNLTAYCETCAAISNVYWNWRMFLLHGESKYYDVLERTLYNGVLSGIGIDGKSFFYPNPLSSDGSYERSEWFGCACCPSNLCRFMSSMPGYIYAHTSDSVYVNLFVSSTATISLGENDTLVLTQQHNYPWDSNITINIERVPTAISEIEMKLRLPGWAQNNPVPSDLYSYVSSEDALPELYINGISTAYSIDKGYITVRRTWENGDVITFQLPMEVKRTVAHGNVNDDAGRVEIERGPIVYCLEWPDNDDVNSAVINDTCAIKTIWSDDFNGAILLEISGDKAIYDSENTIITEPAKLIAIPYYAWANRGMGNMNVWIARTVDTATPQIVGDIPTDTLEYEVKEEPFTDSSASIYDFTPVAVDANAVASVFNLSIEEMNTAYNSGTITYAAIENSGNINTSSTANAPGHWFNALGNVTQWTNSDAVIFSELDTNTWTFNIGQYPNRCSIGDKYVIKQALTQTQGAVKRCVFKFIVDIIDPDFIDEITAEKSQTTTIYNLQGVRINNLQRGINILTMSNGTVKKVIMK